MLDGMGRDEMRAGDADRQAVADRLKTALDEGRLDLNEYDERLQKTYAATRAEGVTFVGVNSRDDRDAAKAFERGRVTYPSIYDPDGRVALSFDVTQVSTPSTLILDRQGRIAVALRRSTTAAELQPLVQRVATEGAG